MRCEPLANFQSRTLNRHIASQHVQHIIGIPLQLIIMGMLQSFIIFIIRVQQFFIMSMFIPAMGIILQVMPSVIMVHSIMHFIIGIGMFIGIMLSIIIGMAMAAGDRHIIDRLPHCIIIGMPQFIIICIMSALFLNIFMSMPAAGFMVHIMPSSIISQVMTAIIIGMPIIGMVVFIDMGICIAFIMEQSSFNFNWGANLMEAILGGCGAEARRRQNSIKCCGSLENGWIWRRLSTVTIKKTLSKTNKLS